MITGIQYRPLRHGVRHIHCGRSLRQQWRHRQIFSQAGRGLYTSAVIQALEPAIFGEKYYGLTGILILGIMFATNIRFTMYIIHKKLGAAKLTGAAFGCMISFLMIQWMSSVVQGVYWYNGAVNYTFFYSILTLLVVAAIRLWEDTTRIKRIRNVLISLFLKKKRTALLNSTALAFTVAGFLFNVTSPGTKIRQEAFPDTIGVFQTIWVAIRTGLRAADQWFGIAIVVGMLLMLPFVIPIVKQVRSERKFEFRYPLVVFILSCGWICAMLCPPIYAMGGMGDGRLINVVYFSFVVLMFVNEFYLCGWMTGKIEELSISRNWIFTAIVLAAGMFLACGESSASYQAILSVKTGEASQYSQEANERYQHLLQSKGEDVVLKAYSVKPYLLYFDDITEDKTDWRNGYMQEYFELKSVVIQ